MENKNTEELLQEQLSYQKRIAKDLHSLYILIIASIIITVLEIAITLLSNQ